MKLESLTPEPEILRELGKRLARMRKQQGHSQQQLADQAGLGVATLRRIEAGQDSQFSSWIKLLKTLNRAGVIESLVPEQYNSPMAEALRDKEQRSRRQEAATDPTDRDWI